MSIADFGKALKTGKLAEVILLGPEEVLSASSVVGDAVLEDTKKALSARSRSAILKDPSDPFYPVVKEYEEVVSKDPPTGQPPDRGVCHEIDLVSGTKYCVTRQWPLPREKCDVIDAFLRAKHKAGTVRERKFPHSRPTFCVRKPNGNGMLWEWLDMPQGLSNAPATFTRLVTQLLKPHRAYAQTYFDNIFVRSRAEHGKLDVENHIDHLRAVLDCMRTNKLYANLDKCIFGAEEIPFLGCFIGKRGLRADPDKGKAIVDSPVPNNEKDFTELARFSYLLAQMDAAWCWNAEHDGAFEAVKESLLQAPILPLPDPDRPLSVVCDASDFAIVHNKELLAMKYALVKFSVHLLGSKPLVTFTDHASLRTATQSPYLSQRMARWLSLFAEYNFEVKYKPGRLNLVADALSRRPDYELAHVTTVTSSVPDLIRRAYAQDDMCVALLRAFESEEIKDSDKELSGRLRARLHRYSFDGGLLYYSTDAEDNPYVVAHHEEDLKYQILYEVHATPVGGNLGREKTYGSVSSMYWWPKMYKWVGTYVRTCETCQRTKSAPSTAAPLASLPVPKGCWQSMSMDFVFGLPKAKAGNTGIVVFVDRLSKMAHLAAVPDTIDREGTALLVLERVFRQHGLPEAIGSDRDPRFTAEFWTSLFSVLGTGLDMSTADHPQADGQTERVNRVVEDILRSVCAEAPKHWSQMLPLVELEIK
uniref:Putative polyprotein n=1 Tax=Phytophthora infestans TaxID=4787 RepID=Q572E5_PHYIN|nr:putative polyprotein [Phytophthora infestans]